MRKSIDQMNIQSDDNQIRSIFADHNISVPYQDDILQLIRDLSGNDQVLAIYLYGSYARNEPKPYSDIDIAVITCNANPKRDLKELIGSYSSKKWMSRFFQICPSPHGCRFSPRESLCMSEMKILCGMSLNQSV